MKVKRTVVGYILFTLSSSQPPEKILNVPHPLSIQFKLYIPFLTTLTNRSDQKKLELIIGDFVKADLPYFDVCISNTPYQVCSFLHHVSPLGVLRDLPLVLSETYTVPELRKLGLWSQITIIPPSHNTYSRSAIRSRFFIAEIRIAPFRSPLVIKSLTPRFSR
jgi:hypothetical protein